MSIVFWAGLSKTGQHATLLLSIGGNSKTGKVLELTLLPSLLIADWPAWTRGLDHRKHGAIYVRWLREHPEQFRAVCPEDCDHLINKTCYVQNNVQNAGQVARIIRDLLSAYWTKDKEGDWRLHRTSPLATSNRGINPDVIDYIKHAKRFGGVDMVRSMVAGDGCMIPMAVWLQLESYLLAHFPVSQWLAYTHGWKNASHLQTTHVASCDTTANALEAMALGWRVFEVIAPTGSIPVSAALCPASSEFKRKHGASIGCQGCPIGCNGSANKRHRVIPRHANGDSSRKAAAARRGHVLTDSKGRTRGLYL